MTADYSRTALLNWLRHNAPDLRIGKALEDGKRVCYARFTFAGIEHELEAKGDDPDEQIVRDCAEAMCRSMGISPLFTPSRSRELEEQILQASVAGDDAQVAALTRELVFRNATDPRALHGRTSFSKREIW